MCVVDVRYQVESPIRMIKCSDDVEIEWAIDNCKPFVSAMESEL